MVNYFWFISSALLLLLYTIYTITQRYYCVTTALGYISTTSPRLSTTIYYYIVQWGVDNFNQILIPKVWKYGFSVVSLWGGGYIKKVYNKLDTFLHTNVDKFNLNLI